MAIKQLHSFDIFLKKEVEEVSTTIQDGKEITVKTKVTKDVPTKLIIKEPNRRERQDLSLFYGISYNEALEKKLMPKVLLVQKVLKNGDPDSPLSLDEDKNLAQMYDKINELRNEFIRINGLPESEEQSKRKEQVLAEYIALEKKVVDVETSYRSLFAHTAESYAQNKAISWLVLNLTYKVTDKGEEPFFIGKEYEDKEKYLYELEDKNDELLFKSVDKLSLYCSLYFLNQATTPEQFKEIEERLKREVEVSESAEKAETPEPIVDMVDEVEKTE